MTRIYQSLLSLFTLLSIGLLIPARTAAQITTAGDCFLKGRFVEVGICPTGAYGSVGNTPTGGGYHARPGGGGSTLGFVADPDMDGWTVAPSTSVPKYIGDYFLPGSPQEGWDVQIDGDRMGGWRGRFPYDDLLEMPFGGAAAMTGEVVEYGAVGTKVYGLWKGEAEDYDLEIRQKTSLDTNKVYFICEVVLKNNGTNDLENIYFERTVDPDNEAAIPTCSNGYTTENTIVYQPDTLDQKCLVSAVGQCYGSYLGLGAKDCRARCFVIVGDGLNPNQDPEEIYEDGTSYLTDDGSNGGEPESSTQDVGIGIIFKIGTLAAGDSVRLAYAYILREADLDSAFAELGASWVLEGSDLSSGDSTVNCVGSTLDVEITGGNDYEWGDWTPTDGLSETSGPSNVITVGTDSITYRVIGVNSLCNMKDTLYITVVPQIVPSPGIDSGGSICINHDPVSLFDYIGGDPPTTGVWTGPGTTPAGMFDPSAAGYGDHEITYTVTDAGGCKASNIVTMNVFNYVDVDFTWDLNKGCMEDTVNFINNSEPGNYTWRFADGTPPDTTFEPQHIYPEQAEYGVWLVVKNHDGCIDSTQKIVDTRHPLDADFTQDTDSICQTQTIVFLDNSIGNIQTWQWDFGDGTTTTDQSPSHVYTLAGTHTVRLIITDDVPCSDTAYATVYIDSIPSLELTIDKNDICKGERVNMSLDYLYTANGFTWTFGDGTDLENGSGTTFHSYDQPGTYFITVNSHHPVCDDATAMDTVVVKPYPVVNLGPDTTLCLNGEPLFLVTNNLASMPAGTHWVWNTGDTTALLKVVHPGTYVATADLDGCEGSDDITITKDCYTDVPNSFTPNGDGVNDYFYPRQLLSKGVISFRMTIFDRWGKKIFETTTADGRGWDGRFNDKEQPVGVYIFQMSVVFKNSTSENYTGNVTLIR